MQQHPLYGAQLRVERADKHLAEAQSLISGFSARCREHVVPKDDGRGSVYPALPTRPDLPVTLPLAVSDAIHNMRAALDYIVFELASHDSGQIQDGTQFLIEDVKSDPANPRRGFDGRKNRCLKGLSSAHVDMVESLQPYKGVEWTKTLRDISNPDKHRMLTVIADDLSWYTVIARRALTSADTPGRMTLDD